jgi:flagellar basal body rod protein FlgB
MRVKNKKLELILGNIANAPTSGINAKDLDFSSFLCSSFYRSESGRNISFGETSSKHIGRFDRPSSTDTESAVI